MSILEIHDVSIRYMTGDFKDIGLKEYVVRKLKGNYHINEFWADRHISFTLEKGDMLGIIGTNGAGKSTLLKVVSGIMEPTGGYVERKGSIAALLELASGFDGDLTVRENTYLRGAMLGYTRRFMGEKYDEIIDFAELREFQDRPFKQLSSGMKSRLAFSIASLVVPDILILDEVLSVGDGAFRKKSEKKMREIIASGATTILVSHSIQQIRNMCTKILWLEHGEQVAFGNDVQNICDTYQQYLDHSITLEQGKRKVVDSPKEESGKKKSCGKCEVMPKVEHKYQEESIQRRCPSGGKGVDGSGHMDKLQKPGEGIQLQNLWRKTSEPFRIAFWSACIFGIITHIYIFTNLILNHDSVGGLFNLNEYLKNARWSLGFLSKLSTGFQLPVVTILIAICMLAFTSALTVEVLKIANKAAILLTSAFLVVFPSVACIFSYMFTADAYFISLFLSALAVYLTKQYRWGWLMAIIFCAISLGGYQSFICYAIGLFLIDSILQLFTKQSLGEIVQTGLKYIGIILASLALYYLLLVLFLNLTGIQLNTYQGLNKIDPFAFREFLKEIPRAYRIFIQYFTEPYYTFDFYRTVQKLCLVMSLGALTYLTIVHKLYREKGRLLALFAGITLLPLGLNFITILSAGGWIHELMRYSFVLLFVFIIKLFELTFRSHSKKQIISVTSTVGFAMVAILVWNSFCVSNITYLRLQVCYENSFATANRIAARIESLDGYSPELPVAFVGEIGKNLYGGKAKEFFPYDNLTGTNDILLYSIDDYTRTRNFLSHYIGMSMPFPNQEQLDLLNASEAVKAMPVYPAAGSIAIQDKIIVVKLSNGLIR
jgi:ABC-2 type transport system ATP-binding protein